MRSLLTTLGLSLLGATLGCAASNDTSSCDLPGDIDCAGPASGDGKADGLDDKNDPARMAQHLDYKLDRAAEEGLARHAGVEGHVPRGGRQGRERLGRHVLADVGGLAQRSLAGRRR